MEEIIKQFLTKTIPDMNSMEFDLPYIKFVFDDKGLEEMSKYINNVEYDNELEKMKNSIAYLKDIKNNYQKDLQNEEDIYIRIDDYQKFFFLLNEIVKTYASKEHRRLLQSINFIKSIWLRMSPSDIEDVNTFLEKQLSFLKYDDILDYHKNLYKKYQEFDIIYENKSNEDWFETNNHIDFSLRRKVEIKEDKSNFLSLFKDNDKYYDFPSIHYAFNIENDNPVCYIYGIQNIDNNRKDEIIKENIQDIKKQLRNKFVSSDFILSLKIFIDFLNDNNIKNIKVPLLQVFNYAYHKHLSDSLDDAYQAYTLEEKLDLEQSYKSGDRSDKVLDYIHDKKMYNKFTNKQDMISKNKTERLINTFLIMQEKYNNIEFINDPFIEGDYLMIKISELEKHKTM